MSPSELKYKIEQTDGEQYFFTRSSMRFFGDTMRNYGVRSTVVKTNYDAAGNWASNEGVDIEVYELYRKKPVKHGLKTSAFFDRKTFKRVHGSL